MAVSISSKPIDRYLLIDVTGDVDIKEFKALPGQYYNEIVKHDITAIIIDESKIKLPDSLIAQDEIVEILSELPDEIKGWRIGLVLAFGYIHIGKYWERQANKNGFFGFKVFTAMDDAVNFINVLG